MWVLIILIIIVIANVFIPNKGENIVDTKNRDNAEKTRAEYVDIHKKQ